MEKKLFQTQQSSISTTDPDSKWMPNKKDGTDFNYNVQQITETKHNFIVNINVVTDVTDI